MHLVNASEPPAGRPFQSTPSHLNLVFTLRLINTQTYELEEIFHDIPPYAILSHTWGSEEVTFREYLLATGPDASKYTHIKRKSGFSKILGACKRARGDGLQFLWCDTNCIDKRSSAELGEAINSMYAWYRDSAICYAYLADVNIVSGLGPSVPFEKSRWLTRGWTLQELLAPKEVRFFDFRWVELGDRDQLADVISKATRIHIGALRDRDTIPNYSIAQRMSWAADRQTSRREDIAYCLLGIFDVNMPLLYGEGRNSFLRLQEEIMKSSDDLSILAWDVFDDNCRHRSGAFTNTPNSFRFCGSIIRDPEIGRSRYSMTNIGLSLRLPIMRTLVDGLFAAGLNCCLELHSSRSVASPGQGTSTIRKRFQVWIWLRSSNTGVFERTHTPTSKTFFKQSYTSACALTRKFLYPNDGHRHTIYAIAYSHITRQL
ncbi:heterokaryon incompatibility protein-domain-containing protein [Nemania sp. FL0916]|nr:heterokaryon incompatibility protein-domain-containing protein [Nemania sp. FL0916]